MYNISYFYCIYMLFHYLISYDIISLYIVFVLVFISFIRSYFVLYFVYISIYLIHIYIFFFFDLLLWLFQHNNPTDGGPDFNNINSQQTHQILSRFPPCGARQLPEVLRHFAAAGKRGEGELERKHPTTSGKTVGVGVAKTGKSPEKPQGP